MGCKAALYAVNNALPTVQAAGIVPFGTAIRRIGCGADVSGTGITIRGAGYYKVSISATISPATAGTATLTLLRDNAPVAGASAAATASAANDALSLSIGAIVRLQCCEGAATLSLALSGLQSVIGNLSTTIEKL